ncbi:MAG: hypothetical protein IJ329_00470 [Clostridia bacterium]|nr:hypothetical protein [Clostridia bacterium]
MKLKRWMVITPIFLALGGGVALFGCSSSLSGNRTYCDDCGACSNCSYTADGNSYQCGEYGCLGETFSCNTVGDCLSCFGLGCTTIAGNCTEQSCTGGGSQDVYRELFVREDFVYRESPEITYFQKIHTENGGYYHEFRVDVEFEFFKTVSDLKITGNVLYNGEVVDSFVYYQEDNSTAIVRGYTISEQTTLLPQDATQENLSVSFTKIEGTVKAD